VCVTAMSRASRVSHATFAIPAAPESASLARKMTEAVLRAWACGVDCDMTILLVDEVFTNAVLHGVARASEAVHVTVELVASPQGLHVEVHDPGHGDCDAVTARPTDAHSESGRGLELVNALSTCWGSKETPEGKYVYFDMAPTEPEAASGCTETGGASDAERPPVGSGHGVERGAPR
jgi:anti-sigma regulatory factor (Ser/Thr protein kinase)